jgi:hypothetical protein
MGLYPGEIRTFTDSCRGLRHAPPASSITSGTSLGVIVQDLLYVGLTIVVFAVLTLILKGIERFER